MGYPVTMIPFTLVSLALAMTPLPQVDLHVDTPTQLHRLNLGLDSATGLEAGLPQLRAGGTNLIVQVLWPPRNVDWQAHALRLLSGLEGEIERLDEVVLVRNAAEALVAVEAGRFGLLIGLEGAHGLGNGDWEAALAELHSRGLTVLGVTWSFSNRFAGSSSDGGGGLTEEGRALVARARELGLVLDLSHASRQTTLEICESSPVPVIASHSDAAALQTHPRNLTDEEIRCIAETGGVIGLNFHTPFVGGSRDIQAVANHADHLAAIGGHGVVALGSDYDGFIQVPTGLEDASRLGALWEELGRRGWTEEQIAGVRGGNFLRAWALITPQSQ